MGKFMKPGKVVMVLAGRYAGRKAVIVKVHTAGFVGVPLSKRVPVVVTLVPVTRNQ